VLAMHRPTFAPALCKLVAFLASIRQPPAVPPTAALPPARPPHRLTCSGCPSIILATGVRTPWISM
jgi:hypothetical protein